MIALARRVQRKLFLSKEQNTLKRAATVTLPALAPRGNGEPHRVAIIGAGGQAWYQCRGIAAVPGVELIGIADRRGEAVEALRTRLNMPELAGYDGLEELIERGRPDLLCVSTNTTSHLQIAGRAVEFGVRRLIIEKPIGNCVSRAREFATLCRQQNVRVAVNHSRRWWPDYRAVLRVIDYGLIGDVRCITTAPIPGGIGMIGSHFFDLACLLGGSKPRRVIGRLYEETGPNKRGAQFSDPSGYAVLELENGVRAFIDVNEDLGRSDSFVVVRGSAGRIEIDEAARQWTVVSGTLGRRTFQFLQGTGINDAFAYTVHQVLSDEPLSCGLDESLDALESVIGVHLSDSRGSMPVSLPLSDDDAALELPLP